MPVLRTRKRMLGLEPGERLWVHTSDPLAVIDIPHFCAEAGHSLESAEMDETPQAYVIRKK